MIRCAKPGCSECFPFNPRYPHQKYHNKACGESARKRWLKPERRAYMRNYWELYVRPEQRTNENDVTTPPDHAW